MTHGLTTMLFVTLTKLDPMHTFPDVQLVHKYICIITHREIYSEANTMDKRTHEVQLYLVLTHVQR